MKKPQNKKATLYHRFITFLGCKVVRASLLKRIENSQKKFVIEQYKELLDRVIPPMLEELKHKAKFCMLRLPPERVKAKFYRDLANLVRRLKAQVAAELEYITNT